MNWVSFFSEAWKQCPAIALLGVAVYAFAHGSVVPFSAVDSVIAQCTADKNYKDAQIDRWQHIALKGAGVLEDRAQSIAEIAPTEANPNGPAKAVQVKARPLSPEVKANIEKPPTATDAKTTEKRIDTASKVLLSAPVQEVKAKGQL